MHAMTLPRMGCLTIGHARQGVANASLLRIIFNGNTTAFAAIDAVQSIARDATTRKSRAAIFGTASPPTAAGAMLLMFNLAIALFVGLGPIFILCSIFEQTKLVLHVYILASTHLIAQTRGGPGLNGMIRWLFCLTALSVSEFTKEVEL